MNHQNIEVARKELESVLGTEKVLAEDFILSSYIRDGTTLLRPLTRPSLITLPHTSEEVQKIIQIVNKYKIPVVPSGGRTSNWGAIDPNYGIVIDMCNMTKIIEIDERNLTFTVQAGANVRQINKELEKRGFHYTTHPLNRASNSMGAEVAKDTGGGVRSLYGHVHKRLIGLEVVLGNGDILVTGTSRVIKNTPNFLQSGIPDLTQLFVASEGAFGVITEVTMAMSKTPVAKGDIDVKFEGNMGGLNNLIDAFQEIRVRKLAATVLLSDTYAMWLFVRSSADEATKKAIDEESARKQFGHVLSIAIESLVSQEECNLRKKAILEICEEHGGEPFGEPFSKGSTPEVAAEMFDRAMLSEGSPYWYIVTEAPAYFVTKLYAKHLELVDRFNLPRKKVVFFNVFSDEGGQVMCWFFPDPHDEKALQKWRDFDGKWREFCAEAGSVPYRIGRIWRPYILDKLDPRYLKYIMRIKKEFDPNNIMNPGVSVFEEAYR